VALRPGRAPAKPFTLHPDHVPVAWGVAPGRPVFVNLDGDYGYLEDGYYASLDREAAGEAVIPTTAEALDAYVVPIALAKAERAGLPVPSFDIVTDRFPPPPVLAYPINPFSSRGERLDSTADVEARRKGLTYTGKYAVMCQRLPVGCRVDTLRVVLGRTLVPEYEAYARSLFACFRLPLAKARVIVTTDAYELSALEPLPWLSLSAEERALIEEAGTWLD
jgi:hypothetical protein